MAETAAWIEERKDKLCIKYDADVCPLEIDVDYIIELLRKYCPKKLELGAGE